MNLRCTLLTWQALSPVWGFHIMAPYLRFDQTKELYCALNEEVSLTSLNSFIKKPKTFRALQQTISIWRSGIRLLEILKPRSITYLLKKNFRITKMIREH